MFRLTVSAIIAIVFLITVARAAEPAGDAGGSATAPAPYNSLGAMRITRFKPTGLIYKTFHGTYRQSGEEAGRILPDLYRALLGQHIMPTSGPMLIVSNPTGDLNAEYDVEIGVPVNDTSNVPAGYLTRQLESGDCATALFCGPAGKISDACGAFYQELGRQHIEPDSEFRMRYLYWEDAGSKNNVMQLEVGVRL